ncbi:hypothetical protein DSUL_20355 [Desulfovibrionales bacterium]
MFGDMANRIMGESAGIVVADLVRVIFMLIPEEGLLEYILVHQS